MMARSAAGYEPYPNPIDHDVRPATILQVLPALVSGGVERGTVDIAAAIRDAGGRALVASAGGPMVHELERLGITHITLPLASRHPWRIWRNRDVLIELMRREEVDIIHARSRAPAWSALWAARELGLPLVTTFHGTYNAQSAFKRWYNSVMARGDRVIAISDFIADHVRRHYPQAAPRLVTIPRGVDMAYFDPAAVAPHRLTGLARDWRLPDGVPIILLPGRVTRWKGHRVLIDALARLERQDVVCLFVGDDGARPRFRRELEAHILDRGMAGRIRFVGACRDMPAAYMLADVVLSASTDPEAFGRVAAEASAMGRPVVATDHGGARETVRHGQTGWLVEPNQPEALAAALYAALELSPEDRAALGARGRTHIAQHFTKTAMAQATMRVYADLLQPR